MRSVEPIVIEVAGKPVAQGRPRFARMGQGVRAFTPASTKSWQNDVRVLARQVMAGREPLACTVVLHFNAIFAVPTSWPAWKRHEAQASHIAHTGKPDLDNLVKSAKDALKDIVWVDDAQVAVIHAAKGYGKTPGVRIEVEPSPMPPAQVRSLNEFNDWRVR